MYVCMYMNNRHSQKLRNEEKLSLTITARWRESDSFLTTIVFKID